MSVVGNRKFLDLRLEEQRKIIEAANSAAAGWVCFYIKERLEELEKLFPGHNFTYTHGMYGIDLTAAPPLLGHDEMETLLDDRDALPPTDQPLDRLAAIYEELGEMSVIIEDEFRHNPGTINTEDEL